MKDVLQQRIHAVSSPVAEIPLHPQTLHFAEAVSVQVCLLCTLQPECITCPQYVHNLERCLFHLTGLQGL